jgi:hypothetical protein
MKIHSLISAFAFVAAASFALASEEGTLQLSSKGVNGTVMDTAGKAVAGAVITLTGEKSETADATAVTDKDGAYKLAAVAEGVYRLDIGGKGMTVEVTGEGKETLQVLYPAVDAEGAAPPVVPKGGPAPKGPVAPVAGAGQMWWVPLAAGGGVVVAGVAVTGAAIGESTTSP